MQLLFDWLKWETPNVMAVAHPHSAIRTRKEHLLLDALTVQLSNLLWSSGVSLGGHVLGCVSKAACVGFLSSPSAAGMSDPESELPPSSLFPVSGQILESVSSLVRSVLVPMNMLRPLSSRLFLSVRRKASMNSSMSMLPSWFLSIVTARSEMASSEISIFR